MLLPGQAEQGRALIDARSLRNNEVILFTTLLYNAIASRVLRNASASYSIDAPPTGSLQHVKCLLHRSIQIEERAKSGAHDSGRAVESEQLRLLPFQLHVRSQHRVRDDARCAANRVRLDDSGLRGRRPWPHPCGNQLLDQLRRRRTLQPVLQASHGVLLEAHLDRLLHRPLKGPVPCGSAPSRRWPRLHRGRDEVGVPAGPTRNRRRLLSCSAVVLPHDAPAHSDAVAADEQHRVATAARPHH